TVIWANTAYADLLDIVEYIAKDSPATAGKILQNIKSKAADLTVSPQRGRVVPELQEQGITLYRELIIDPWRLIYRITDATVLVFSVIDGRQNVEDILLRRLVK
ncbi:MAG: type II toxin-antitoxin system RelE/ParE family toxin, partial [Desulfobulbaceae bacterium]|nr:type II toxin-antitoxin system RelE/ParE family toxin [Desulfobulbaceae bacterium]